jgi:hypothetical protein
MTTQAVNVPGSLFIECLPAFVTEKKICDIFARSVGDVERVDFIPIDKKRGFDEDNDVIGVKSAFVHFRHQYGEYPLLFVYGASVEFHPEEGNEQYIWVLSPNKNPIPQTMMNTSQIVDNCRYLEDKICSQQYVINVQETKIRKLEEEMLRMQFLVRELIESNKNYL